jgi:hypothetical protein
MRERRFTTAVVSAQMLARIGTSSLPALRPGDIAGWTPSATEAGWLWRRACPAERTCGGSENLTGDPGAAAGLAGDGARRGGVLHQRRHTAA